MPRRAVRSMEFIHYRNEKKHFEKTWMLNEALKLQH